MPAHHAFLPHASDRASLRMKRTCRSHHNPVANPTHIAKTSECPVAPTSAFAKTGHDCLGRYAYLDSITPLPRVRRVRTRSLLFTRFFFLFTLTSPISAPFTTTSPHNHLDASFRLAHCLPLQSSPSLPLHLPLSPSPTTRTPTSLTTLERTAMPRPPKACPFQPPNHSLDGK
jgi:hypothetical protein